ncbi:MAG: phospholipase D-like domain-containing protein [Opitutaceae bacterium]
MPPLLEKIRIFRRRSVQPRTTNQPAPSAGRDRRRLWLGIVVAVAVVLGFFFWYTSARLLTEPIRIDYGPADASFANAMGPLTGADFTDGNSIETLVNGDAFFPAMLQAIREAKKTITLETYIWESGYISNLFINALTGRAQAGVKVHALVDGMGALKLNQSDWDRLQEAGVQFHKYGREHWWEVKPNINHRTHRKLLVVDGKIGFAGGMCIADAWLGNAHAKHLWRDTQVRVAGPAVRQMQAVFAHNWLQTTSVLLLGEDYFPKISKSGSSIAHCYKSGPGEGPEVARLGYLFAIASARTSIDIANAYFVPDDLAIDILLEAISRGVKVRVVVPAINDSRFGRLASRSRWGKLIATGAEFYLYQPAMYHAKTMVVDGVHLTIGSSNFDNRSFAINDEVTVSVLDRKVAEVNVRIFEDDMKKSKRLTIEEFESRPLYVKAIDHMAGWFRSQL